MGSKSARLTTFVFGLIVSIYLTYFWMFFFLNMVWQSQSFFFLFLYNFLKNYEWNNNDDVTTTKGLASAKEIHL